MTSIKETLKKPESAGEGAEAEELLAELEAEIGGAQAEVTQSVEEALARRDQLAGENKRLSDEVKKLREVATRADGLLSGTNLPAEKRAQLADKANKIKLLLEKAEAESERNAKELAGLEQNPEVYGAMQEQAARENLEKDPLAPYEAEVKLQKKAVNDVLAAIVDLWKKDNGRALRFESEDIQYSPQESEARQALADAESKLIGVKSELSSKKFFKSKLEARQAELIAVISALNGKIADWDSQSNITHGEKEVLDNNLQAMVGQYVEALEAINQTVHRLPHEQSKKYKTKIVSDPQKQVLEDFPELYNHGPGLYVDNTKLFERFGYKRDVPKKNVKRQ